jgi:glycosyltransferase involved in cell wall biosynthesis
VRVLVFTNMYPSQAMPFYGSFVRDEAEALREAGIDVDVYFVNGRANKLNYFGMPAGFFARIQRKHYDVIHVHHSFCGLVATLQSRIPVVWTFHEGEISGNTSDALREQPIKHLAYSKRMKRHVASKVDAVVVVAEHLRGPLGRPDALWLPSGIDWKRFAPMDSAEAKHALGLAGDRRYVLFPAAPARVESIRCARRNAHGREACCCTSASSAAGSRCHDRPDLRANGRGGCGTRRRVPASRCEAAEGCSGHRYRTGRRRCRGGRRAATAPS